MISEQDLLDLRSRVIRLEGQVDYLYKHLGITFNPALEGGDDPRIIEELRKGKMIEAIKIHRELYNTGLAEAKRAVEDMQRRLGI